ncbi:energy-coupling factor ABC transporter permease [Thiomicrospira sp. R3]|uniref:energy-coupling factor ABC transporter permease n=1 Tax=Thiomicrospira sp. R3 TaxID=3035472 RepID=UPI00259BEB44|nr:energy-coupling factor ABC transporter permease [Thiomicrospira sp. R3]WFE68753.1 energy-coupling factor ABC transporter permease [Thiomicrospira sp. R3]
MNLPDGLFGMGWWGLGWVLYVILLLWALKTAPWYKVKSDRGAQNVLFGAVLVIILIWSLSASIGGGFSFHFLLMTVATLMFGPQFAVIAMTLALLAVSFSGDAGWTVFGLNALLMGWIPIFITWWMYKLAYRYLDRNFFVYVFLNGFLAAGVGALVAMLLMALLMGVAGVYTLDELHYSFLPYIPMIAAPEAFLNGFIIAGLVLMKPEWVSTFSDEDYLKGK